MIKQQTHTLGSVLNETFASVPKIWFQALVGGVIFLLPGTVAMILGFRSFDFSALTNLEMLDSYDSSAMVGELFGSLAGFMGLIFVASLLFTVGQSLYKTYIYSRINDLNRDEPRDDLLAFGHVIRRYFLRVFTQDLVAAGILSLISSAVLGVFFFYILAAMPEITAMVERGAGLGDSAGLIVGFIFWYLFTILALVAATYWIQTKLIFGPLAVVEEGHNSLGGLGRSLDLIRGHSWRVFGNMFVVELILGFAASIITGPIMFIAILPDYMNLIQGSLMGTMNETQSLVFLQGFLTNAAWGIAAVAVIQEIVLVPLRSVATALLWTDLKIRQTPVTIDPVNVGVDQDNRE